MRPSKAERKAVRYIFRRAYQNNPHDMSPKWWQGAITAGLVALLVKAAFKKQITWWDINALLRIRAREWAKPELERWRWQQETQALERRIHESAFA